MGDINISLTPPEVRTAANEAISNLLPTKSKPRYEQEYLKFMTWCNNKQIKQYSENCLIAYFQELQYKKSLWSVYSMLKSCLSIKHNLDISKYSKLIALIKRTTEHHIPKKSAVLEDEQITKFINEAPDREYLLMKAALIMGISGACRREELCKMATSHLTVKDDIIIINIPDTKTNKPRTFVITKADWVKIIQKYLNLRSKCMAETDRLFYTYRKGKCINIPVGINTLGKIPTNIAKYLNLHNPQQYIGHCFRRTSATLLANKGGDLVSIKRHGGWKSSAVAESYIEDSLRSKIAVADTLTQPGPSVPLSTSASNITLQVQPDYNKIQDNQLVVPGVSFSHCENCTINITVVNNSATSNI